MTLVIIELTIILSILVVIALLSSISSKELNDD